MLRTDAGKPSRRADPSAVRDTAAVGCAATVKTANAVRLRRKRLAACLALLLPIGASGHDSALPMLVPQRATARLDRPAHNAPWLDAIAACCTPPPQRGPRPRQIAATLIVTRCTDSGPGSLRDAAAAAQSGDLIDLSALTCSKITLTTGQIALPIDDITLRGPGASALAIDGDETVGILSHTGHGVIDVYGVTLQYARIALGTPVVSGACVYSAGSIVFDRSAAVHCQAYTDFAGYGEASGGALAAAGYVLAQHSDFLYNGAYSGHGPAIGGAITAGGDVYLNDSRLATNVAESFYGNVADGGAVYAIGNVVMTGSTIAGNEARGSTFATPGYGGGIFAYGFPKGARGTQIVNSTISGNSSHNAAAVEILNGNGSNYPATISNSTIAYNAAGYRSGGVVTTTPILVANSTLAFNASGSGATASGLQAYSTTVNLQSSILANNIAGQTNLDFDAPNSTTTGSNNLVVGTAVPLPVDTIRDDPRFETFGAHGGPTMTITLRSGSPAIDHGNNLANLGYDQRGPGYPRNLGSSADIGAVEYPADRIFADNFE